MDCTNKCLIADVPKECLDYCMEQWASKATIEEKQLILGLRKELAKKIYDAYNSYRGVKNFDDLRRSLTSEEIDLLREKARSLNQYQVNYFNLSSAERKEVVDAIKKLNLDRGPDDDDFEGRFRETADPVFR